MKSLTWGLLALLTLLSPISLRGDGGTAPDLVDFPLPANWQRKQVGEIYVFTRPADPDSGVKTMYMLKPVPKVGTLAQTFLVLWPQMIKGLFPNEPLENKMVPLVIRNRNGVAIAFDGDGLRKNPYAVMLYLIDIGDAVVPGVITLGREPMGETLTKATSDKPTPAALEVAAAVDAISLKNGKSSVGQLFDPAKMVGVYTRATVAAMARYRSASGANLGDASTGMTEDIEFKANGAYEEMVVPVVNGRAQDVQKRSGHWKLDTEHVIVHFNDRSVPDQKWLLMGMGVNRRGDKAVLYLVDRRFTDKWLIEMFLQGADMNTYFYTRK